jgi:ABC-2 type transport system permease protein
MMRGIRLVLVKELRDMSRDARLLFAICLGVLLVAAASVGAYQHYQRVAREKADAAQAERARWLNLKDYNPHGAAHHGIYVFKPESPLTAFDPGTERFLGVSVWLEAHKQNQFVYRPMQDAAPVQRFSTVTPAAAVQLIGPLIIILLGFNAFAGERDQGTLRQLLSLGTDGRILLLGKAAAIAVALALVLLPALILLIAAGIDTQASMPWRRLVLLIFVYIIYLGTFLAISLAVSAFANSARSALAVLLAIWVFNGFLVPRGFVELADLALPLPSVSAWRAELEADMRDGHAPAVEQKVKQDLLKQYGVETVEALPVNWRGVMLQRGEEQNYPIFDAHFARLFDRIRWQDQVYQWGGVFAPMLALQSLSMGLASSDFEHHRQFVRAAEDHRRIIQKTVNEELTLHPEEEWGDYIAGPDLWARVPEFRYELPEPSALAWHYVSAALILAAWFAVSWGAALTAASKLRL